MNEILFHSLLMIITIIILYIPADHPDKTSKLLCRFNVSKLIKKERQGTQPPEDVTKISGEEAGPTFIQATPFILETLSPIFFLDSQKSHSPFGPMQTARLMLGRLGGEDLVHSGNQTMELNTVNELRVSRCGTVGVERGR